MAINPETTLPFYLSAANLAKGVDPETSANLKGDNLIEEIIQAGKKLEEPNGPHSSMVQMATGPGAQTDYEKETKPESSKPAGNNAGFLWALAYLDYAVQWGQFSEGKLNWGNQTEPDWARIKEFRLFGPVGEYYVWRTSPNSFASRLRLDPYTGEAGLADLTDESKGYKPNGSDSPDSDTPPNIVSEWLALWGTRVELKPDGWLEVSENRGARLLLPFTLQADQGLPLRVLVRHYLSYDEETGLARFTDLRMVRVAATPQRTKN
jgi:CRISPR-associated protein (TIGR03984 family)